MSASTLLKHQDNKYRAPLVYGAECWKSIWQLIFILSEQVIIVWFLAPEEMDQLQSVKMPHYLTHLEGRLCLTWTVFLGLLRHPGLDQMWCSAAGWASAKALPPDPLPQTNPPLLHLCPLPPRTRPRPRPSTCRLPPRPLPHSTPSHLQIHLHHRRPQTLLWVL